MAELTLAFLLTALAIYTLFGGADFGGGLLELALRRHPRLQRRLEATLAPIWEANHVWLIAVIVILFVGFPTVYTALSTHLFFPLSLALLGIVFRGAFFTFRKYDPEPETRKGIYSLLFRAGSVLTPTMFGFVVAALLRPLPVIDDTGEADVFELFVAPWFHPLGVLCAVFVNLLFAYLAAAFFYGEVQEEDDRRILRRWALRFFVATIMAGAAVLGWGILSGTVPWKEALNPVQLAAQGVALAGIPVLLGAMRRSHRWGVRFAAGAQVLAILAGWFSTQFPAFVRLSDGTVHTYQSAAAPGVTLFWLNLGLAVVLLLVIPPLAYLYRVFHTPETP